MISVHDMKLESTVTYQEGCEFKRNTIYKRCPLIDLIENALLENRFMIPNFKRRISGYVHKMSNVLRNSGIIVEGNNWVYMTQK